MFLLFAYLFLALFVSFLCSIMESVLLSTPPTYLMVKSEEGHEWAGKFLTLKENIDKPLSAILSLNTVAHTIGAAGVGSQATQLWGEEAFGWVSAILTILILVITEIIPKTIGSTFSRQLSKSSYYTIKAMIFITYPIVAMSAVITKLFTKPTDEKTTSREEIAALASIGEEEGLFSSKENKIIQNILQLNKISVTDIMTPRVVVAVADQEMTLAAFIKDSKFASFSRIPIYAENDENITGYIRVGDAHSGDQKAQLKDISRKIIVVPKGTKALSMFEKFVEQKEHIAQIVDEYGGLEGIITQEDIIESLLGLEIVDETDSVVDMREYAKEKFQSKKKN